MLTEPESSPEPGGSPELETTEHAALFDLEVEVRRDRLERGRQLMDTRRIADDWFDEGDVPRLRGY